MLFTSFVCDQCHPPGGHLAVEKPVGLPHKWWEQPYTSNHRYLMDDVSDFLNQLYPMVKGLTCREDEGRGSIRMGIYLEGIDLVTFTLGYDEGTPEADVALAKSSYWYEVVKVMLVDYPPSMNHAQVP